MGNAYIASLAEGTYSETYDDAGNHADFNYLGNYIGFDPNK